MRIAFEEIEGDPAAGVKPAPMPRSLAVGSWMRRLPGNKPNLFVGWIMTVLRLIAPSGQIASPIDGRCQAQRGEGRADDHVTEQRSKAHVQRQNRSRSGSLESNRPCPCATRRLGVRFRHIRADPRGEDDGVACLKIYRGLDGNNDPTDARVCGVYASYMLCCDRLAGDVMPNKTMFSTSTFGQRCVPHSRWFNSA